MFAIITNSACAGFNFARIVLTPNGANAKIPLAINIAVVAFALGASIWYARKQACYSKSK
jgi:hypothetical protein